jgi:hypothetical protein
MTDMREINIFLNAKITIICDQFSISQTHCCLLEVFKTFDYLVQGRTANSSLPIDATEQLAALHIMLPNKKEEEDSYPYRQNIGALLYLLCYLQGQSECVIEFTGSSIILHCFSNADWGGGMLRRRSTTSYIVFAAGGHIFSSLSYSLQWQP